MDGELLLLLIGAVIGILGSILGYALNHLLTIRERRIIRDFEIREKGRGFYHQTYGLVAVLSDLVVSVLNEKDSDRATVLTEKGYASISKDDIVKRYKKEYEKYSKFWYESRDQGLEVFLLKEFSDKLELFWGYAVHFNSLDNWDNEAHNMEIFKNVSKIMLDYLDKLMGLNVRKSRIPKWLNPKKWRIIIRSEKLG